MDDFALIVDKVRIQKKLTFIIYGTTFNMDFYILTKEFYLLQKNFLQDQATLMNDLAAEQRGILKQCQLFT